MRAGAVLQHASRGLQEMVQNSVFFKASFARSWASSSSPQDPTSKDPTKKDFYDHATGLEKLDNEILCRAEIEGLEKGVDIFDEEWITKDFSGTPEDPVVVESAFLERIVGVPDPEDDCLVIWDLIKANEPPKQIVEGGEYFVLNTSAAPKWTEIPESFKGEAHH